MFWYLGGYQLCLSESQLLRFAQKLLDLLGKPRPRVIAIVLVVAKDPRAVGDGVVDIVVVGRIKLVDVVRGGSVVEGRRPGRRLQDGVVAGVARGGGMAVVGGGVVLRRLEDGVEVVAFGDATVLEAVVFVVGRRHARTGVHLLLNVVATGEAAQGSCFGAEDLLEARLVLGVAGGRARVAVVVEVGRLVGERLALAFFHVEKEHHEQTNDDGAANGAHEPANELGVALGGGLAQVLVFAGQRGDGDERGDGGVGGRGDGGVVRGVARGKGE